MDRRTFLLGGAFTLLAPAVAFAAPRPLRLDPKFMPQRVAFRGYGVGTIVVKPRQRFLYFVDAPGSAIRYGVGVGRAGLAFQGSAKIGRKAEWPSWRPTDAMIRRQPKRYAKYAGGMPGGPGNPLGARALYLYRNGRDTLYRIHGTTEPASIGQAVSNGCIRMLNEHVMELYARVSVGAPVVVA